MPVKICAIFPCFDRPSEAQNLIRDLASQDLRPHAIVVVDHGHKELGFLPENLEGIELHRIRASSDLWFTQAINRGLRFCLQELSDVTHVLLCNDDIRLSSNSWLKEMLGSSKPRQLVSCCAVENHSRLIYSGVRFSFARMQFQQIGKGLKYEEVKDLPAYDCDALPTRSLLLEKQVLLNEGLLDESRFPHYGSDYDWSYALKKKAYRLLMLRSAYITTDLSPQSAGPGKRSYASKAWRSFWSDLFSSHKNESILLISRFASRRLPFPYSWVYVSYHFLRKIFGFLIKA